MRLPIPPSVLFRAIYGAALLAPLALSAATISTPSLGEIYTIPSWMPTSVSSSSTPGSRVSSSSPPAGSGRITADTYAAYAAAQEAVLERLYFASAGNGGSNSASARDPSDTQYWFFAAPPYAFRPVVTNLVMSPSTRILPNDARKWVPAMFNQGGAVGFYYSLGDTSFIGLYSADGHQCNGTVSPSPSSSLLGDVTPAFPAFDWTTDTASAIGDWTDRGLTFRNCAADFLLPYGVNQPLGFFGSRSGLTNGTEVTRHPTLTSVLSNSFAQVDARWITNTTERLVWNRLAAADELLAAVDRMYLTETEWGNVYLDLVETSMSAVRIDEATVDASATYLYNGEVFGHMSYLSGWTTVTNYVSVTNRSEGISSVQASISMAGAGVSGAAGVASVGALLLDPSDFVGHVEGYGDKDPPGWPMEIYDVTWSASGGNLVADITIHLGAGDTWTVRKTVPYVAPSSPFTVGLSASAAATYTHSIAPTTSKLDDLDVPRWPSWRAFSTGRIKEIEIASLVHFSGDYGETNEWRCAHDTPTSISSIRSFAAYDFAAQIQRCARYIEEQAGADPSSSSYVSTLVSAAMDDAEARTPALSASLGFVARSNLDVNPPRVVVRSDTPVEVTNAQIGGFELSVTPEPTYGGHTRPAARADCESRQFYRADFLWKTLRAQ